MIGREPELLAEARALMPRVIPGNLDVLIVHEIGKEISGAGLDPNITGRSGSPYFKRENSLKLQRIVVLNLSKATGGNAMGIGLADVTTDKVVKAMNPRNDLDQLHHLRRHGLGETPDPHAHGPRSDPAGAQDLRPGKSPAEPHRLDPKHAGPRAHLGLGAPPSRKSKGHPQMEIEGDPAPMPFDEQGNLLY